jgi:hypothetical protein
MLAHPVRDGDLGPPAAYGSFDICGDSASLPTDFRFLNWACNLLLEGVALEVLFSLLRAFGVATSAGR